MSRIGEKVAYLKGLAEGLGVNAETEQGRLMLAMIDTMEALAGKCEETDERVSELSEYVEEIDSDVSDLEEVLFSEDEDDEDDWDEDYEDYEDDEDYYDPEEDDSEDEEEPEEGFDFGDEDSTIYEVECACGNVIDFDEEVLESGSIVCPKCGETLEFSFEDEEDQ